MGKVRSRDTTPEIRFRKALWSKGLRYRLCPDTLPGKPDIVIPAKRLVVFIDGDFWHGVQWRRRNLTCLEEQFSNTKSKSYWLGKIRRNMHRDCVATAKLLADDRQVLRFWESQIKKDLAWCVEMTLDTAESGAERTPFAQLPAKTFAEFFAGIGLMRMALERHGWNCVYANDIDSKKREMYEAHFEERDSHFHEGDVHKIDPENIPRVTLATASFPCVDLSLAGARRGLKGGQSSAIWGFLRIIDKMGAGKPPLILLENVPGFLTSHKGHDFRAVLLDLNQLGYTVDAFVIDALNFVPQSRPRLFVIGVLDDKGKPTPAGFPEGRNDTALRPKKLLDFMDGNRDVRWSLRNLPTPIPTETRLEDVLEELPDKPPEWWSRERAEYLLNQMNPKHRAVAEHMINGVEWSYGTVFRRMRNGKSTGELRTDGVAGCLRTPRGGSARQILFKAGRGKYYARLLTPRECAGLMGADEYRIEARTSQALFGFGDAVCVPVIEWIAQYYLNPLINELIRGRPLMLREKENSY